MKKLLSPLLISLFLICGIFSQGCGGHKQEVSQNVKILDSLLNKQEEFTLQRLKEIKELKQKRDQALSYADRYLYDNLLFEYYFTLNADSALRYADAGIESAEKSGNEEWLTQAIINKSSVLAASGMLSNAWKYMKQINPATLSNLQLVDYYGQMIYLYSHMGNYVGSANNDYYVTERLYKDSIMNVIPRSHPDYLWYKSWDILGTSQSPDSVIDALQLTLENSGLNNRQDAKNAYALARLYRQKGDLDNYEKYMALSAIIDVKIANAEIASLEELSKFLYDNGNGDVDRAFQYMDYSLNKALDYPNRIRAFGIAKKLKDINTEYQKQIDRQQKRTTVFLVLMCIFAGILGVAVVGIIWQNKKVVKEQKNVSDANLALQQKVKELSVAEVKLQEMNQLLQDLNTSLKNKNQELREVNYVKEEYLGYVFQLCSNYIDKIEALKRDIYLKAIKKQYKAIENETYDLDMREELKEFYHSFDTIFLTLYPNFVKDFNTLCKPDRQIVLKEGELLNMELRIYALVRLGITDSVKIADFHHCAAQTVYNYRLRARSRALYDKAEFLERVKSLGSCDI